MIHPPHTYTTQHDLQKQIITFDPITEPFIRTTYHQARFVRAQSFLLAHANLPHTDEQQKIQHGLENKKFKFSSLRVCISYNHLNSHCNAHTCEIKRVAIHNYKDPYHPSQWRPLIDNDASKTCQVRNKDLSMGYKIWKSSFRAVVPSCCLKKNIQQQYTFNNMLICVYSRKNSSMSHMSLLFINTGTPKRLKHRPPYWFLNFVLLVGQHAFVVGCRSKTRHFA